MFVAVSNGSRWAVDSLNKSSLAVEQLHLYLLVCKLVFGWIIMWMSNCDLLFLWCTTELTACTCICRIHVNPVTYNVKRNVLHCCELTYKRMLRQFKSSFNYMRISDVPCFTLHFLLYRYHILQESWCFCAFVSLSWTCSVRLFRRAELHFDLYVLNSLV